MAIEQSSNYWKRIRRRQLLKGAAAGGLGALGIVAVGCGSDNSGSKTATAPAGSSPAKTSAGSSPTSSPAVTGNTWLQNEPDLKAQPKTGGTLKYGTYIRAASLDPIKSASFESANMYTPVYSGLFRAKLGVDLQPYNPWGFETEPDLATKIETPQPGTHVLTIRQDAFWHDKAPVNGRQFTADDAKYTLDLWAASKEFSAFLPIDKTAVSGANQVTVTLKQPVNYFTEALCENRMVMLPKEVAEADGDFSKRAIGTGAFVMDAYTPNTSATYKKHPKYYRQGLPYLDQIDFEAVKDEATAAAAFLAGKYPLMRGEGIASEDQVNSYKSQMKDAVIQQLQSRWQSNVFHMAFNVSKPPYNDPRVLKALSKGWDRDAFGKQTFGEGKYNILGPYSWVGWFDKAPDLGDAYKFDPNAAKQLLSAAAVSNLTVPFDYFPYSQTMDDTIQYWAQQMKQNIDVTIQLNKMEYNTYQTKYFSGQLENGTSGFVATFPRYAPISARLLWKSDSSRNVYHIKDDKMDAAIDKMTTTTDKNEQKSAFKDFWNQLVGTPYIEQMVEGQTYFVWKKNVHNWLYNMYHDWGGWGYQAMERLWIDA